MLIFRIAIEQFSDKDCHTYHHDKLVRKTNCMNLACWLDCLANELPANEWSNADNPED